jgi:hypothetical protein
MFSSSIHFLQMTNFHSLSFIGILAIENNAAINMSVQVSLLYPDLQSFRYIPRSGIAESCRSTTFSFLKNLYTVLHDD